MPNLWIDATEFIEGLAPDGGAARACVALARGDATLNFPIGPVAPGPYTFSVYLKQRRSRGQVTLILCDPHGENATVAALTPTWSRHDVTYETRSGQLAAILRLGSPGEVVPVLTDAHFFGPQVEEGWFPSSLIGEGNLRPAAWAQYSSLEAALAARAATDGLLGLPASRGGNVTLTHGALLTQPSARRFALPASAPLHHLVRSGAAPAPDAVSVLDGSWAGSVPLPLSRAALDDVFRDLYDESFALPCLVDSEGRHLRADAPIVVNVETAIRQLVESLNRRPEDLHALDWRKFEELVAHLLDRDGYEVKLTPRSGDHGIDVLAIRKKSFGQFVVGIQCKRYGEGRKVEAALVRELLGSLEDNQLERGVFVTTTFFTPGAKGLAARNPTRLELLDYTDLVGWLRAYQKVDE